MRLVEPYHREEPGLRLQGWGRKQTETGLACCCHSGRAVGAVQEGLGEWVICYGVKRKQ
jgi:hypothetical protein